MAMKGVTIDEIAETLHIHWKTAHKRIERLGIKPISYKAQYDPSVIEAIRDVPGQGRPKKAVEQDLPVSGKRKPGRPKKQAVTKPSP